MGTPMAAHVAKAGHDLTVWNRTPKPGAVPGAREAKTVAAAVDGAEVVVTMLFGPDAVRAVLAQVPENAFVVESSTIGPAVAREVAAGLARFLDAPVVGSVGPPRTAPSACSWAARRRTTQRPSRCSPLG